MRKSFQPYLILGFMMSIGLNTLTRAGQREPILTVNLHVINYAEVPEDTLIQAEQEVTNILHKVGVDIVWLHVPVPSGKKRNHSLSTHGAGVH